MNTLRSCLALLLFAFATTSVGAQATPFGQGPRTQSPPAKKQAKPAKGKSETKKKDTAKKPASKKDEKKDEIKTRDASDSEIELPPNATEDDIRAIRGEKAMRDTEKRLAQILKKMKIKGDAQYVRFDKLDAWPYEDGYDGMPKHIKQYDGKRVAMAGFMLPIDEVENIRQFYLVKSLWSCCFGIPPDVNGLVKINVKAKKGVGYQYDPILIVGTFRLKKVMDEDYCVAIFQIDDAVVKVIELD